MKTRFTIHTSENILIGKTVYAEDAACLVSVYTEGKIMYEGHVVWHDGHEDQLASESYDYVADTIHSRIDPRCKRRLE